MLTNQSDACLTAESMARLAHGELTAAELACLEEHISACESCRNNLESSLLDAMWRDNVLPVLQATSEDYQNLDHDKSDGHDEQSLESLLKLLGPTDDPHKLGRIGTYEVIGVIGRGGMGVVFKAFDAALNRFVAIKMLLPHLAASGAARKRFAREGQAAAAVIDDNVLPIYSVAEWQGVPYLVTQYSRGMTLQKRIQDQGSLELKEILRIGMQTARGLAAAHAQGLVHRDVKPSNILLDGTVERALLTDFGLARAVDDASITRTGVIAGTPQYMSPEQARGGSVDARSDLFGLGCVLYAMCTGRPPFRAENSYAVLRLITDEEPRPIREINPEIPEWLCRLIHRLMAKLPNDRFSSAAEVATLLEQCLAHVQQPTVAPVPEQLRAKETASQRMRIGQSMVAIGALMIGLLGLFGFVISIQSQVGTLLIESSVDDVTVRVSQGDTVVRKLTVTKAGTKLDVAAGSYTIAIEGNVDGIAIENGKVNLRRGGTEIVKLTYQRPADTTSSLVDSTTAEVDSSEQPLKLMENAIFVTDVRSNGQVLYFKLNHRKIPEGALGLLEVQFRCEKAMPSIWTGPTPDAATVVSPTHTVTWIGTGYPMIPLPIGPEGHKVAFIFPDNDSAVVAAKQLAAIGDQSLIDTQRRANAIAGRPRDDGIIFGEHAAIGKYTSHFRVLYQVGPAPSLNLSGSQLPKLYPFPNTFQKTVPDSWFRRDPFKELSKSPENPVAHIRMSLELAAWEPAQRELELTMEQQVAIAAINIMSMPTDPFGIVSEATERARERVATILTREQQTRLDQLVWQRLVFEAFETPTMQSQLELAKEQKQGIRQAFVDHKQRTLQYDAALAEVRQSGMADAADIALAGKDREVLGLASLKQAWDAVYLLLTEKQREKFNSLRGPLVRHTQQTTVQDPLGTMSRESLLQQLEQEKAKFPLYDSILAESSGLAEKLRLAERVLYDDRQAFNSMNTALSNDFQQWQRDYRTLLRAKEIIPWLTQQPEHRALMLWAAEYHSTNRSTKTQNPTLDQLRATMPTKPSEAQLLQFLLDMSRAGLKEFETSLERSTVTPTQEQKTHCYDAELLRTVQDIQSLYVDVAHHTSHVGVLQRHLDHTGTVSPDDSASPDATLQSQLQGVWRLSGWAENDGELEKVADPADDFRQIVFRGNVAEITLVEGKSARFTYTIDASSSPAAIDWKPEGTDLTLLGVVELSNGTLKLSMSNNETPVSVRPSRLAPQKGSGYFEFRRDAAVGAGQPQPDAAETASTRLLDVLKQDMDRELSRFPLLDHYREALRLLEGGGLEILEKPVKEDREQYAKDHPDLAKAFEAWQSDYRDVIRVTEVIPVLFDKNNNAHEMMVTVAKLLIESEDIPGILKERVAEAHKQLGDNPTDETVEKLFLGLAKDQLFNLQRELRESGANVPHTGTHEDHLRIAEEAETHLEFARLYCAIEQSEMFRQIRKLQESVDPATVFLFEESHPIKNDETLVFISSRGREEVRAGERGYIALPEPSVTVTWKVAEQELRLKNADAFQVTHVIIDRRKDGSVVLRCFGIPQVVSVIDDLNAVLPQEGIVDLNTLANSTEEAKVRRANRRLRDPNAALLAELQGTWLMTAIVARDGTIEPVSDPVGAGQTVHFKNSTLALYQGNDQEPLPLNFTLDASTPTPEIDIEGHDGMFTLGLIETQNGTLHLQLGDAGGERPSDSIKPAVHYQYRRIPASLVALGEQKTEGALNPGDLQQQEAVLRDANRQLKDPNRVLLAQLQGSWTATAIILPNGQLGTISKPAETGMTIRFDDKSGYISQGKGDDASKFTYTIDATTSPAEIDLKYSDGTHALGLLEIKNGTLELQLGAGGDARPSPEVKPSIHQLYRPTSVYWQWIPARE